MATVADRLIWGYSLFSAKILHAHICSLDVKLAVKLKFK